MPPPASVSAASARLSGLRFRSPVSSISLPTTSPFVVFRTRAGTITTTPPPPNCRLYSNTTPLGAKAPDSTPGWEGRSKDDHAVNRSPHDPQADSAHQAMKQHDRLQEGSQAISRKDEGGSNKKAKEDHPEAPEPVIGMNDEKGSKGLQ